MARPKTTAGNGTGIDTTGTRKTRAASTSPPLLAAAPAPAAPARKAERRRRQGRAHAAPKPATVLIPPPEPIAAQAVPSVQAPTSKQAGIVAALRRPQGATIAELMQLTGWLSHSVRGVLAGALKRKLGLLIDSRVEPERGRTYRIVEPVKAEPAGETGTAPAKTRRGKPRRVAVEAAA